MKTRTIALTTTIALILGCGGSGFEDTSEHPSDFPVGPLQGAVQRDIMTMNMMGDRTITLRHENTDKATCFAGRKTAEEAGFVYDGLDTRLNGEKMKFSKGRDALIYFHKLGVGKGDECLVIWMDPAE